MGTLNEDLTAIKTVEDTIIANKVANFAYTDEAYSKNYANGVTEYNVNKAQNIPTADPSVLKVNDTVLSKGYRARASSITRMLINHFLGRLSYNVNKVNDGFSNLVATLIEHRGTANGFATLDENGKIPYSQLPESTMEYKGQWNAETNTPTLVDGTGMKGNFYIVSVAGTHNFGSGDIQFFVNDRVIYDGSVWSRLSAGDVKTVNNISPENGNIPLTGENIPVSSTDPTLLSAPLTTDRYADSSVTTEKIADNAVTNAKIKDPISVDKGGTGKTTILGIQNAILGSGMVDLPNEPIVDESRFVTRYGEPSDIQGAVFGRKATQVWDYIKSKISSVLGLTATQYNGNAKTATNAVSANTATTASSCSGNSATATKATQDGNGKNIADTYATKSETDKIKYFKGIVNNTSSLKYYVIKNIPIGAPIQIMGCVSRVDTIDSVFNFTAKSHYNAQQTRIVGIWNNSNMHGQTWKPLPFKLFRQSDGTCNLWVEIPSYSMLKVVMTSYNAVDYNFVESTFSETGTEAPNEMFITATNANNAYRGMVHTCSTDAGTASKTVSITGFTLTTGACIRVVFTNGNSVASPTLNVNNTGAKEIRVKQGSEYVPLSAENGALGMGAYGWQSNTLLELFYNGTYWIANENAIVHENLNSELGYLSSRVFINGRKKIWGGTSPYDITANESKVMTISSDLPINDDISNHSLSVITEIESTYVNAYGDIKLMDNTLKFSIYSRNLTNNSYRVKTVHIFVTGY